MGTLHPADVWESDHPVFHTENGRTIAYIDARGYMSLQDEQRREYRKTLLDSPELQDPKTQAALTAFLDRMDAFISPGSYSVNKDFVILDNFLGDGFRGDDQHVYIFTVNHERGHAHYDLHEAGADFVAAVESLLQFPEVRETLELTAAQRLLHGFRVLEKDGETSAHRHGAETAMAINAALRLKPEDLEAFRSMSDDERMKALVSDAKVFDTISMQHDTLPMDSNPYYRVHVYLKEALFENDALEQLEKPEDLRDLLRKVADEAPFVQNGEERRLMNDLVAAGETVIKYTEREEAAGAARRAERANPAATETPKP